MYTLVFLGAPPLLRGRCRIMCIVRGIGFGILMSFGDRYGIMYTAKGPDVCPGFPWDFVTFAW